MNQVSRRSGNSAPPGVQGSPAAMRALIGFPPRRSAVGVVVGAAVVLGVVGVVGTWPRAAPVVVATLLFAVGGAGAGVLARVVLARMRRGARVRAPVCEVAVAVFWGSVGAAWGAGVLPGPWVPALLGLGWLAVACSVVDVLHHRLPDALTLPALPVAVVVLLPLGPDAVGRAVAGSVVAVAVHAGVRRLAHRALGGGDVKLAAPLGAVLAAASWPATALGACLAAVLSGAVATVLLVGGRAGRSGAVPHGPSMLLATWLVVAGAALGAGAG